MDQDSLVLQGVLSAHAMLGSPVFRIHVGLLSML